MSSGSTVEPGAGRTYGVTHVLSDPFVWLTMIWLFWVHVAQSVPVESLSMTIDSTRKLWICAGKPASSVYVWETVL
jgi:hypothetical protein